MRFALTAVLVALIAFGSAAATMNPECKLVIDFNGSATTYADITSQTDPADFTAFTAYVVLVDVGTGSEVGMTTISFKLAVTAGTSSPPSFTSMLPGGLAIGSWDTGVTLASTDCMSGPIVYIGSLSCFYLGTPGAITIEDHPEYPRWVVDCNEPGELDYYCVWSHGGVNQAPPASPDPSCLGDTAIEAATWSTIKSLYQ